MPWATAHRPARAPGASRGAGRALALLLTLALTALTVLLGPAGTAFAAASLNADGSSWAGPAIEKWRTDVADRGISINFTPNGSAAGRQQWENGQDDFTASDVPFRTQDDNGASQAQHGSGVGTAENPVYGYSYVPITAGGTAFMYNLSIGGKKITDLRLSTDNLVDIFTGKITYWDDPKITASYGKTLPHIPVTPVIRSDGSGATAQFSRFMEHTHQAQWDQYCSSVNGVACGDYTEFFPPSGRMIAQNGSDQVAHYIEQPSGLGAIGYDEYAFALTSGWPVAKVLNPAGYYSLPTASNVAVALTAAKIRGVDDTTPPSDPNFLQQNLDGVYANKDPRSYPVSSYSYVIVPRAGAPLPVPPRFSDPKGAALSQYLDYVLCAGQATGNSGIDSIGYSPIPQGLVRGGLLQVTHIPGYAGNVDPNTLNNCPNPTFDDTTGKLLILETAPQPNACDLQGQPLTCNRSNPSAGSGSSSGSGSGGSSGGSGSGGTGAAGTGSATAGNAAAGAAGSRAAGGSASGGGSGGGSGAAGGTAGGSSGGSSGSGTNGAAGSGGTTGAGGSGAAAGAGGANGSTPGDGTDGGSGGGTVDPQTGEVVQDGGSGGGGGTSEVAANVVNVGGRPQNWTLTTITALELLAVVAVPPFLGGWLRRRRQAGSTGGPR
ncbi:substrate-binding domain-containing protein [Kitasatospora sp. NBC_01287]|uniref:substrate-binding domain-containing protein n=1 Tax=Kitasatospora sp. NBC_01287 TaxID=2903573 RepID=UPI0022503D00|nr:substrate-binding domain-containing protein [Kitasatospora sp. NBC_01287]MCX4747842.1 substrate-binding domain-containing protein [Kitasatospora sp. NBC_01287]